MMQGLTLSMGEFIIIGLLVINIIITIRSRK